MHIQVQAYIYIYIYKQKGAKQVQAHIPHSLIQHKYQMVPVGPNNTYAQKVVN
jgi:hypothetical protein